MTGEAEYDILCAVKRDMGFLKAKQRKGDKKMERIEAKIAFFIEKKRRYIQRGCGMTPGYAPREVTAVFVDSGNYQMKECYAHVGQHGTCAVDWIAENCRPATYAEYKPLYDELNGRVGYDIEVVDAEWWIAKTMDYFNAVQDYYEGKRDKVA